MATILNPDVDTTVIYNNKVVNIDQLNADYSTMTSSDEAAFKQISLSAGQYGQRISKQKHYDFKTSNASFLQLYQDLKQLGVKNNKFFLRIFDTDLIGVNPYAMNLPREMQIKIFLECLVNPWYWLREVLRIPTDGLPIEVGGGVQYRIDRNNAACWYLFLNGIDHYQSKPRQQGKTQDCVAKFNYAYHFANSASTMLFFNKDQDQANINLYRLKCQRDMMPTWMQMRMVLNENGKFEKGTENTKSISNPVNNNKIVTMGKATSVESAMKLGRGATAALQYYDEFDFIPYQITIMNAASFAYSTASQNAAKYNSLFGRILSSTPGDLDTKSGKDATDYIDKMVVWKDKMFDEPIEKIKKAVRATNRNKFVFVEHSWQQLKLPVSWYEEQCANVSFDQETILREIELKRIHGSNNSPFDRKALMYLTTHQKKPIESIDYSKNYCPINIYEKIYLNKVYMMCIDPAEGISEDNNAMTLIDPTTQKPVAEFRSPYISQPDLCRMLCKFLDERCPKSMIIIENNRGRELINRFLETPYAYQLYYDDGKLMDKPVETTDKYGALKKAASIRRSFGITTSGSNRHQYFDILMNVVEERKELICTEYLVNDTCGLIRKPNGRVEHATDGHDDNIMSYLIGLYIYLFAPYEKLEEFGIRRGASDDFEDYDDDGNLTEEGTLKKLAEMYSSLPPEMQQLIAPALQAKDPAMEARQNVAQARRYQQNPTDDPLFEDRDDTLMHKANDKVNEAYWGEYDSNIWQSNYPNNGFDDPFGGDAGGDGFDINDYID